MDEEFASNNATFLGSEIRQIVVMLNALHPEEQETVGCRLSVSDELTSTQLILTTMYAILAAIGLPGNFWVLYTSIAQLYRLKGYNNFRSRRRRQLLNLVLCLSIADTLVLLCLPFIVTDMLLTCWPFGEIICKLLWMCEMPNKILSTFLLVALSANCFLALYFRNFYMSVWLKHRCTLGFIGLFVIFAICSVMPVFLYADVYAVGLEENNFTLYIKQRCLFSPPEIIQKGFSIYTFCVGFCLCSFLQFVFYGSVITKVYRRTKGSQRPSHIPFRRVTKNSLGLVLFYFACWAPHWITILCVQFAHEVPRSVAYAVYVLPYLNSAVNPTMYHRINRNEEKDFQRARNKHKAVQQKQESYDPFGPPTTTETPYPTTTMENSIIQTTTTSIGRRLSRLLPFINIVAQSPSPVNV